METQDDVPGHGLVDNRGCGWFSCTWTRLGLLLVEQGACQSWMDRGWDGLGCVEGVYHVLGLQ